LRIEFERNDFDSLKNAMRQLQDRLLCKTAMVTLSELGVMVYDKSEFSHEDAHPREINDVSGAGDPVISVAALSLAAGVDAQDYSKLANLAGGLVCEKVGVVPVDKDRLLEEAIKSLGK
jgi:bifunctional ADP-heptose synthase (sugar kinase/adenylyltransferase)